MSKVSYEVQECNADQGWFWQVKTMVLAEAVRSAKSIAAYNWPVRVVEVREDGSRWVMELPPRKTP
jgi:hypothetical protein